MTSSTPGSSPEKNPSGSPSLPGNAPAAKTRTGSQPKPEQSSGERSSPRVSEGEYEELYSPSKPKEEQGFSPVTIAIYIVIGLLLVAGIGGSIIGFKTGPLGHPHKVVSSRSISTRTTFKTLEGPGWKLSMSMLLTPSVAYMKYSLSGSNPIKIQLLGVHYKIGNGSDIPLKLAPAYLLFEPLRPKEEASRAFWLGGSPVDSITLDMRIDDGHGIHKEILTFD